MKAAATAGAKKRSGSTFMKWVKLLTILSCVVVSAFFYSLYAFKLALGLAVLTVYHFQATWDSGLRSLKDELETLKADKAKLIGQVADLQRELHDKEAIISQKNRAVAEQNRSITGLHRRAIIAEQPTSVRSVLTEPSLKPLILNAKVDQLAEAIPQEIVDDIYSLEVLKMNRTDKIQEAAESSDVQKGARRAVLALAVVFLYHITMADAERVKAFLQDLVAGTWKEASRNVYSAYNDGLVLEQVDNSITSLKTASIDCQAKYKYAKAAAFVIVGKLLCKA